MLNKNSCNSGFTLIELLVVVLIIGILASVALPQYQKTVKKAKLAQLTVATNAAKKGVDLYLLAEGYPADVFYLTADDSLDIKVPGSCDEDGWCSSRIGAVRVTCMSPSCYVSYESSRTDTEAGASWLDGIKFNLYKFPEDKIWTVGKLMGGSSTGDSTKIVCQWLKEQGYPAHENVTWGMCQEVGVTLEQMY